MIDTGNPLISNKIAGRFSTLAAPCNFGLPAHRKNGTIIEIK